MADAGGAASPSPASADTSTGSRSNIPLPIPSSSSSSSLDGGAFLLHLLQNPPPETIQPPHHQNHFDPAVAAVGPSRPFLPHDFHPPPAAQHFSDILGFPSFPYPLPHAFPPPPGLWPPPGLPLPGGGSAASPPGHGNRPFFPIDQQRFDLAAGGMGPLAASPPRTNLGQQQQQWRQRDSVLGDQVSAGRTRSGSRSSSLRPPPGFRQLPIGRGAEPERGAMSRVGQDGRSTMQRWKPQAERSHVLNVEQNHYYAHGERGRATAASARQSTVAEPGKLSGQGRRPHGLGQWVAATEKNGGNHRMARENGSHGAENHQLLPSFENDLSRGDLCNRELFSGDVQQKGVTFSEMAEQKNTPVGTGSVVDRDQHIVAPVVEESEQVSDYEAAEEEDITRMQHEVDDGLFSRKYKLKEEDMLQGKMMDSLTFTVKTELKNVVTQTPSSRGKDFRSDFSRGHHVSSQRIRILRRTIQCRHDIDAFTHSFLSIFESLVPAEEEITKQKQLLLSLGELVNKEWPNAKLYLYGSCANSFGVSNSDVDVCLSIDDKDISKSEILLKLADILQSGDLQNVQALTHARVPIVKMMDPITGLSCDICINNLLAVVNTKLLKDYALIDDRLRQLAFIVKHWARSRRVNETYQGTLSSYAYVLMCIHFLQLRRPSILPCLQAMEPTYAITVDNTDCAYFDQVERLQAFGSRNNESIARLVWAFFQYWAYHHDYTNDVISVRTGSIISKRAKDWTRRVGNDRHLICIEDPFEVTHDLGRVVDKYSIKILREEFERAANIMQYDPNPTVSLFEPYIRVSPKEGLK